MREVFRDADIAHDAREPGDQPGGFNSPDRLDGSMRIGSRHGYQYTSSRQAGAREAPAFSIYRPALASACARIRSSCCLSSGVYSAPKSSASQTWRSSTSVSRPKGARLSHSVASSFDFTCQIQNPATSSFVSENGPSMTVRFFPEKRTRTPFELG